MRGNRLPVRGQHQSKAVQVFTPLLSLQVALCVASAGQQGAKATHRVVMCFAPGTDPGCTEASPALPLWQ